MKLFAVLEMNLKTKRVTMLSIGTSFFSCFVIKICILCTLILSLDYPILGHLREYLTSRRLLGLDLTNPTFLDRQNQQPQKRLMIQRLEVEVQREALLHHLVK
jgi:hypothetical protein